MSDPAGHFRTGRGEMGGTMLRPITRGRALLAAALIAGVSLAPGVATADPVDTFKEYGFLANTAWSDCPWDSVPADGATCTTYEVAFGRFDQTVQRWSARRARRYVVRGNSDLH